MTLQCIKVLIEWFLGFAIYGIVTLAIILTFITIFNKETRIAMRFLTK